MKAKHLLKILEENPELDVIFWDGNDNWDIDTADVDSVNKQEIVLTNKNEAI
jgi:hypothetical protein